MHESMRRVQHGPFLYYTCSRLPVRHAFTTRFGGVSTGHCESLNLGFNRGDEEANVRENYRRLAAETGVDETRFTLTKQIHESEVSVVTEDKVGMGLHRPMAWQSDAIVTALPDTPLVGFYADCVVTLLYDPRDPHRRRVSLRLARHGGGHFAQGRRRDGGAARRPAGQPDRRARPVHPAGVL